MYTDRPTTKWTTMITRNISLTLMALRIELKDELLLRKTSHVSET